jgi:Family of unknown function (DUF6340)
MKNIIKLILIVSLLIPTLFLINSCGTRSMSMSVLQPADIFVPRHIEKVGVLNHSLPAKDHLFGNIIEGLFSGESIRADREGSFHTIQGLTMSLNNGPRFDAILLESEDYRGTGTDRFPELLSWEDVDRLCKKYGVDAIVTLATFDSDIRLKRGSETKTRKVEGEIVEYVVFWSDLRIRVNSGWRIYDNANRTIVDESVFTDEKAWSEEGSSPSDADHKLPSKRLAINDAGSFSGYMYNMRISPTWIRVSRSYYVKGHDDFKIAKDFVKTNQWDKAAEIWERLAKHADPKIAGRASYNMALFHEYEGELGAALEWAKKAYNAYGLKKASSYINTLQRRIADQKRLDQQIG